MKMAIKLTREDYIWQWASGEHLTESFPDEVVIGDDEAMQAWVEDHKIEANEYRDEGYILSDISTLATDVEYLIKFLKERGEL
jgi:hypothetical protein